jgi:hypothetical protein
MRQRQDGVIVRRRSRLATGGNQGGLGRHLRPNQAEMGAAVQHAEITTVGLMVSGAVVIGWCAMGGVLRRACEMSFRRSRQRHRDSRDEESDGDERGEGLMGRLTKPAKTHVTNLALYVAMATLMAARAAAAFSNPRVSVWVPSRSLYTRKKCSISLR